MKLETFNHVIHREELIDLFIKYFKEVHGDDYIGSRVKCNRMLQEMLTQNKTIYYIENTDGRMVGFLVMYINDQYGMTTPTVVNDYMYVLPEFRSGKAVMLLYAMIGIVCEDVGMDCVSSTFVQSANTSNNILVGGEPIMTTNLFRREKFKARLDKYKRRILNG